nr:hypothetical protein [uncultured Cohaesibacter sp.]
MDRIADRAILDNDSPLVDGGVGHSTGCKRRFGIAIGWRIDATFPGTGSTGGQPVDFGRRQQPAFWRRVRSGFKPAGVHLDVLVCVGDKHDAVLAISDVGTDTLGHITPELVGGSGQRDIGRLAQGLADPAQIARGLLGADFALFQNDDRKPTLGQRQRSRNADNATADDATEALAGRVSDDLTGASFSAIFCSFVSDQTDRFI